MGSHKPSPASPQLLFSICWDSRPILAGNAGTGDLGKSFSNFLNMQIETEKFHGFTLLGVLRDSEDSHQYRRQGHST